MFGREHLARFGFRLVSVELVEEDAHDILAAPCIRIDAIADLGHPFDELLDELPDMSLLLLVLAVHVQVHLDLREHITQQVEFEILPFVAQHLLVDGAEDDLMELGVVDFPVGYEVRVIAFRYQGAGGEYHAMVQVLYAELEMQAVVDPGRQLVDMVLVDAVLVEQSEIVADRLQRGGCFDLFEVLEHAQIVAVV